MKWWRKAADAGESAAQQMLGLAYASGTCGLELDTDEAFAWMLRSADQGSVNAMHSLSVLYAKDAKQNPAQLVESVKWMQRAADLGHPSAQCALGSACLSGSSGKDKDVSLAAIWLHRACQNGDAKGRRTLESLLVGFPADACSLKAQGLPLDSGLLGCMSHAAARGHPDAQHCLALVRLQGLWGASQDPQEAKRLCEAAVARGSRPKAKQILNMSGPGALLENHHETPAVEGDRWILVTAEPLSQ